MYKELSNINKRNLVLGLRRIRSQLSKSSKTKTKSKKKKKKEVTFNNLEKQRLFDKLPEACKDLFR